MMQKILPALIALGFSLFEYRIKRVVSSLLLMVVSAFFALLAIVCGLLAMFFALADMRQFIAPSLITGGVTILIAILVVIEGKRMIRKKTAR